VGFQSSHSGIETTMGSSMGAGQNTSNHPIVELKRQCPFSRAAR